MSLSETLLVASTILVAIPAIALGVWAFVHVSPSLRRRKGVPGRRTEDLLDQIEEMARRGYSTRTGEVDHFVQHLAARLEQQPAKEARSLIAEVFLRNAILGTQDFSKAPVSSLSTDPPCVKERRVLAFDGLKIQRATLEPHPEPIKGLHSYHQYIFVQSGGLQILFPDKDQVIKLASGRSILIPAGQEHHTYVETDTISYAVNIPTEAIPAEAE